MLKKCIWCKDEAGDFEMIEIEIITPKKKSMIINHKGKQIKLSWDSELTFPQLMVGRAILIYIIGDDYSKGYALPQLRDPKVHSLDKIDIYESELDKAHQRYEKKLQEIISILKGEKENKHY